MPRSVTEPSESEPNAEMSLVGYVLAAGSALLLIPLAPFIAVLWVIDRLFGGDRAGRTVDRVDYRTD